MNYFVVYNVLSQQITAFCLNDKYEELFNIMRAGLKNGDMIMSIEDNGYRGDSIENRKQCQDILFNLANGGNLTYAES